MAGRVFQFRTGANGNLVRTAGVGPLRSSVSLQRAEVLPWPHDPAPDDAKVRENFDWDGLLGLVFAALAGACCWAGITWFASTLFG